MLMMVAMMLLHVAVSWLLRQWEYNNWMMVRRKISPEVILQSIVSQVKIAFEVLWVMAFKLMLHVHIGKLAEEAAFRLSLFIVDFLIVESDV